MGGRQRWRKTQGRDTNITPALDHTDCLAVCRRGSTNGDERKWREGGAKVANGFVLRQPAKNRKCTGPINHSCVDLLDRFFLALPRTNEEQPLAQPTVPGKPGAPGGSSAPHQASKATTQGNSTAPTTPHPAEKKSKLNPKICKFETCI